MNITAFDLAQRFVGIKEVPGQVSNPAILAMLKLDQQWPEDDSVPWCSAFVNYIAWLLRLPRSKSLRARSWLSVGYPQTLNTARIGFDVVILKRGQGEQPGPRVIDAPGHVGFFAGWSDGPVCVLGGNQADSVNTRWFGMERILDIRRLIS